MEKFIDDNDISSFVYAERFIRPLRVRFTTIWLILPKISVLINPYKDKCK